VVAVKYDAGVASQVQTPPLYSAFLSFNKTLSLVSDAVECVGCYLDELQMHLCVTSMHTCSACTYERGIQHLSLGRLSDAPHFMHIMQLSFIQMPEKGALLYNAHMHNGKMCPAARM